MAVESHSVQEEIRVGDVVQTTIGVGVVTHLSKPVREGEPPMLEVDLGHKWVDISQVRSILRHQGERPEPQWRWDEHE